MPDRAYRNVLGAFAFTALAFGAMLRIPSRRADTKTEEVLDVFSNRLLLVRTAAHPGRRRAARRRHLPLPRVSAADALIRRCR